jgi:SdrD B-like domain
MLTAALLPIAALAATPAHAQDCSSAGNVCGYVWNDVNQNGIQDAGETGIEGAVVSASDGEVTSTDASGYYFFFLPSEGTYDIAVQIPPGTEPSPANVGDDTLDSDGVLDGFGNSVASITYTGVQDSSTDFGFFTSPVAQPGTATPGYWKNHPEAWPVGSIDIGGVTYSEDTAIYWLNQDGKDKTVTMFSSLLSAKLNVLIGNDDSCVATTITQADAWMATYGPVGSGVHAASYAWKEGPSAFHVPVARPGHRG